MIYAIVDIGSNTIKMDLYDVSATHKINLIQTESVTAALLDDIENQTMNDHGINKICKQVKQYKEHADRAGQDHFICFATASLRKAVNAQDVIQTVFARTGETIQLIHEKEEALLSMKAVHYEIGNNKSGLMLDMGGGSTEKVVFEKENILLARSMPFGSLSLYQQFVKDTLPHPKEAEKIAAYVCKELKEPTNTFTKDLYIVGGTGRAICSLHSHLHGKKSNGLYTIPLPELISLKDDLLHSEKTENILLSIVPERKRTLMPGLIAICALAETVNAAYTHYSTGNIRKGYLLSII